MQPDPAGDDGTEAEQRGEIEDVRPENDASANSLLVVRDRGDRGGDLRRVCSHGRHHAEQRF